LEWRLLDGRQILQACVDGGIGLYLL